MGEITHGLRAVLSYSKIYDVFQNIVGGERKTRSFFTTKYIKAQEGDTVLDIGCGTAKTRDFLPAVKYYGFDPNPHYIKAAQKRLRDVPDCTLFCATADEAALKTLPQFDIILAQGVLHHLDDETAVRLAHVARIALKKKGRFILVDPCFVEGQPFMAHFLAKHDRGRHVRTMNEYKRLMSTTFGIVNTEIRHDIARFPYTHLIMECMIE